MIRVRTTLLLPLIVTAIGCAPAAPQNAQLEAAVERFEAAAARAEAAAAEADASAQRAAAAAQRVNAAADVPPYAQARGTKPYRHCAELSRAAVRDAAQASDVAQRFLGCLGLDWGKVAAVSGPQAVGGRPVYRVTYGPNAWEPAPSVLVGAADGRPDLAPAP
ncbi:MAG: hypothetical protein SF182_15395 [Deltaproteobacteria bacterium]|nr:hypothetical protein [Deltaproteobacteria bacterium]